MKEAILELGGVKNDFFNRNYYISVSDAYDNGKLEAYKKKLNYTDVYRSVYTYDSNDIAEANLMAPLYFDLDIEINSEEDFKKVVRDTMLTIAFLEEELFIDRDTIEIYFSGSKGFHLVIPFELIGLEPSKVLDEQYKIIAKRVQKETIYKTVDLKVYERKRLFRLNDTINSKTGLYKTAIRFQDLVSIDYEKIQNYAKEKHEVEFKKGTFNSKTKKAIERILLLEKMRESKKRAPRTIIPVERKELLPCVEKLLAEGTTKGGRNNTCIAIASSVAQSGVELEEATDILMSWNDLNEPPLPQAEVVRTVRSAYQMAEEGRGYGCSFFRDNNYCIGETCKLF